MVPYSLIGKEQNSGSFYIMLNIFTDIVLDEAHIKLGNITSGFTTWIANHKIEKVRPKEEYILELITMGVLWNNYSSKAVQTSDYALKTIKQLYQVRKKNKQIKNLADTLRGIMSYWFLEKKNRFRVEVYSMENYHDLLEWLSATGEFNEEVIRLKQWLEYFKTLKPEQISEILKKAKEIAITFNDMGRSVLGGYTQNVDRFREKARDEYKYREDYFFVHAWKMSIS